MDLQVGSVGAGAAVGAVTELGVPTNAKARDAGQGSRPRPRPCAHSSTPRSLGGAVPDGGFLMHRERRTGPSCP